MNRYVNVLALFSDGGEVRPVAIYTNTGIKYEISRVTGKIPAASLKSGVLGTRYTCYIGTRLFHLFYDENKWFLEVPDSH
ncbi:MAG: hypothetical protein ACOYJB_03330 [Christensenellaceae bacterium]|jgi:hypothetical protein